MRIDGRGVHYKVLNEKIHQALASGEDEIILDYVNGQRYIADAVQSKSLRLVVNGTPGNDLAAFMDGPTVTVHSNAQDAVGNTMNDGKIVIHGDAGDIVGYAMRGGVIYIKGNAGYRVGIHMKAFKDSQPVIVIGGRAGNFLGEYMAGGLIILLGLENGEKKSPVGTFVGTGMHAGKIYIRGQVQNYQLGKEIRPFPIEEEDRKELLPYLQEFSTHFGYAIDELLKGPFVKLLPYTHRPYGKLYAY